jgi:hypothetical protein
VAAPAGIDPAPIVKTQTAKVAAIAEYFVRISPYFENRI